MEVDLAAMDGDADVLFILTANFTGIMLFM
jgi:hypothetical protein